METQTTGFSIRCISSLEKVFPDEELEAPAWNQASALQGETYSFQVAYCADRLVKPLVCRVSSGLANEIAVRFVGLVPSELPCYSDHDDNVLRTKPGLYPDPLYPAVEHEATGVPGQWRSFWLTADIGTNETPGVYTIGIEFCDVDGRMLAYDQFTLEVIDAVLSPQTLIHTEWLHADCLATHYRVEPLGEEHWTWIERYVRTAAKHGINMILTPLFTPPLDTAVGAERPTVQLVDVERQPSGEYVFSFEKLARWFRLCMDAGIRYFEFSHLFTQWGARHAPKIMANTKRGATRIFGWDTDASGAEYGQFLEQLLPRLVAFIQEEGLADRCCFHISDEPAKEHMEHYRSAAAVVHKHLAGFPIIDALSDYSFYEQGLVRRPIPSVDHIEPFLDGGVPDLWTYYCCAQSRDVSNRFFNMPSARNRILGMQLYKFRIAGFLHWGFNFWYRQYSTGVIDPFRVTDAGLAFPSGDPFLVYPGSEGPIESIRMEVMFEAIQDLRALQRLESFIGRDATVQLMEAGLEDEITFKRYPTDAAWLLEARERINRAIAAHSDNK